MDDWVNWGDFLAANQEPLAKEQERQAAEQKKLDAALEAYRQSLQGLQHEDQDSWNALFTTDENGNLTPTGASEQYNYLPRAAPEIPDLSAPPPGTPPEEWEKRVAAQRDAYRWREEGQVLQTYSDLMRAQHDAQLNYPKHANAPGWETALWGSVQKDPWEGWQGKASSLTRDANKAGKTNVDLHDPAWREHTIPVVNPDRPSFNPPAEQPGNVTVPKPGPSIFDKPPPKPPYRPKPVDDEFDKPTKPRGGDWP